MRILVFGGAGMLGHKLVQELGRHHEVFCTIRGDLKSVEKYEIFAAERTLAGVDVNNVDAVRDAVERARAKVVINAVGVIKQLPSASDVITTLSINSIFPQRLAELSRELGFRLITVSTDCVFLGNRGSYTEADPPDALDLYGQSKHWGEVSEGDCLTLRTSIIGRELNTEHSLIEWFLSNRGGRVRGFSNAIYSGFPTIVFADIIGDLVLNHSDLRGLYHVSSEPIDKFSLLQMANKAYSAGVTIERFEDFHIDRSLNSERFQAATGFRPPSWGEMIDRMASDPTPYDTWR
jgi:dTDP-4-dehydrorhamnose reductase